jgi:hypothetical protein
MKTARTGAPAAPPPLPQEGGSWIRQADGSLVREAGTEPAPPGVQAPLQDPLSEA